jgi:hypothetical protein
MYHVSVLSDDHPEGPSRHSQALCMLETYLETDMAPGPVFSLPRSRIADRLLCRWAFEKADVAAALIEALDAVPLIATPAELAELSEGWAASAAALVHPVSGLQARLNAYLHVLLAAGRTADDDRRASDDAVDVEGDDVPLYVAIEAGTRWRAAKEGHRSLGAVVREMAPEEQTSSLGLGVAGALLSGGPLSEGKGEGNGEDEGEGGVGA